MKLAVAFNNPRQMCRFSIRRWIEGCEAPLSRCGTTRTWSCFSIRRWIEGCEAQLVSNFRLKQPVSVSADGSKGVKPCPLSVIFPNFLSFSIRRWIEGCEATDRTVNFTLNTTVSVSADGSKGVKLYHLHQDTVWFAVSVSADGSKGVKPCHMSASHCEIWSFSIRRWIEGCEAAKPVLRLPSGTTMFQYPQMDRRV